MVLPSVVCGYLTLAGDLRARQAATSALRMDLTPVQASVHGLCRRRVQREQTLGQLPCLLFRHSLEGALEQPLPAPLLRGGQLSAWRTSAYSSRRWPAGKSSGKMGTSVMVASVSRSLTSPAPTNSSIACSNCPNALVKPTGSATLTVPSVSLLPASAA